MIKTDAINLCLRYIGEAPIPEGMTLDELDTQHEAVVINQIIDEASEKTQLQGWWFNTEPWTFRPDITTQKIGIPNNVLYFKATNGDYILKGTALYNRDNQTYIFTEPIEADVIWSIVFADLPTSCAYYVAYTAAKEAQMLFNGDTTIDKDLSARIQEAYIRLQREHLQYKRHNLISGSRPISRTSNPAGV